MTLEEVYKFYGSSDEICEAVGIQRQSLTYWRRKGYVPYRTQVYIEMITRSKLVAEKNHKYIKKIIFFKYRDKRYGLCEVVSIRFTKGIPPKIIYISPENKKITVSSIKNLITMRGVKE